MQTKNTLHSKFLNGDMLNLSVDTIKDSLDLESNSNAIYSAREIVYPLINACTTQTTVNQITQNDSIGPSEGAIRYRLRNMDLDTVQSSLNKMLKNNILKTLPNSPLPLAIDFVLIPFYGEEENRGDTVRSKARQGTTHFFSYSSIYVIKNKKRYTLAVKYVKEGESLKDTIDFLIKEVRSSGVKIKSLYLDREFFTVKVIKYLQKKQVPFIIPCVLRGRSGGIRNLLTGRKSYSTTYTMHSKDDEATFQVNIVTKYSKGKYKRKGVKHFAYAVYNMDIPVQKTFNEYRKRFGIESSYKLMNASRARTSSKKPALRLLYLGLGFLLINIWIYIQWTYLSIRRKGGRQIIPWSFKTMLRQITRKLEDISGFNQHMPLQTY
jgi:putative transposase